MLAVSFHGVRTAAGIFQMRHWLKMSRIDAAAYPAQVIQLQSFRNPAFVQLVRGAVSLKQRASSVSTLPNATVPISQGTSENPAAGFRNPDYLLFESLG